MPTAPQQDPTLRDLIRIFDRRRRVLQWTAGLVFLLAVCACIFMTRRYTATSEIELQKSSSDGMDLDSIMGGEAGGAGDSLSVNLDLQTQSSILQSEELELKVIDELGLEKNADFQPRFEFLGAIMSLITPKGPPDPAHADLEHSPGRRTHALRVFNDNLKVKLDAGTRLIDVDYSNPDPKVAAAVTNLLIQKLIDFTFQTKYKATYDASQWLEGQLGSFRKQNEDLQTQVVSMQKDTGLFGVGGADLQGKPLVYSPVLDTLQQTTTAMSQAEENRVLKGAVYEVVKTGNAELISQLSGTSIGSGTSTGVQSSLALIQTLRTQEATLQTQISQDATAFGAAYPKLIEERASLKRLQSLLQDEIDRMGTRAKNDYEIALKTEAGARAANEAAKKSAEKLNDKTIEFTLLSKEADESQGLYQELLKRLKEAGILEGLHSSNITVVYDAAPPAKPSKPNVPLYLSLGLGLGIFLGCGAAMLADAADNKVRGVEEIEGMGIPLLGIVPEVSFPNNRNRMLVREEPNSIFSESIRSLRSVLLISRSGTPPKILLVTSANAGEGKSTLSLNLAGALAQQDKQVLLLEADLRRPILGQRMNLPGERGLSTLLANEDEIFAPLAVEGVANLFIIPAGPTPPFPAELLGSPRMAHLLDQFRKQFDFVLIDSPPILPIADVRSLVGYADATVLVTRAGATSRVALRRSYQILLQHARSHAVPAIGAVLNAMSLHSAGYYGYYGYYGNKNSAYYGNGDKK